MKMDIFETRRTNLKRLINDQYAGSYASFADAADMKASQISRFFMATSNKNSRNIGEKTARKIEHALNLQVGLLDEPGKPVSVTSHNNEVSHIPRLITARPIRETASIYKTNNNKKSKDAGTVKTEGLQDIIDIFEQMSHEDRARYRAIGHTLIEPEKADNNGSGKK